MCRGFSCYPCNARTACFGVRAEVLRQETCILGSSAQDALLKSDCARRAPEYIVFCHWRGSITAHASRGGNITCRRTHRLCSAETLPTDGIFYQDAPAGSLPSMSRHLYPPER
ncbi:hypothetical protein PsYK624_142020 [Phanerochaete sordida]|uniref:Uncharacterized protein n=1 Tax=Phanerochaete sordida TaxID=48140 RepID=A0A9P3GR47_9APHY|nr:hypothetical protein PsYK624_142020 [Phanerochaete sordida]